MRKNKRAKRQEMSGGTRVTFDSGSEGPSHDPYGWDSITVYRLGHEFEFESHALGDTTFKLDGKLIAGGCSDAEERRAAEAFKLASGGWPSEWMRWHERAHSRCSCGCRELGSMPGYPGEHFQVCVRCGNIVSASFHESEII